MSIAIVDHRAGLSDYLQEICHTWGLIWTETIKPGAIGLLDPTITPTIICPATSDLPTNDIERYVAAGGTAICLCPRGELAGLAGVDILGKRHGPLRLRVHGCVVRGLLGEALPIAGPVMSCQNDDETRVIASLYVPNEFEGESSETPGITIKSHGQGRVIAMMFDLPRCIMMLRQGDPALADQKFPSELQTHRSCKPTNLATDIGPFDSGTIPYADLLGRLLVDLTTNHLPMPIPMLSTLPANTTGMVLLSGDEDNASIEANNLEMQRITEGGGRMNLYMIPNLTQSTRDDTDRYQKAHNLGPHPNLVPLCDESVETRVAEYERQIKQFQNMFNVTPRSVRNHAAGWVGYLDLVDVQERCGIRMDANYFSCNIFRERVHQAFSPFGGALPMRFVHPDGRMTQVFQQHTQVNDDVWFAPDRAYSYKFSPAVAETILNRLLDETSQRFEVPITTNFHPGNWDFAGDIAINLMRMAREKGIALWSLDQWLDFWEARDTWKIHDMSWHDSQLDVVLDGHATRDDLCVLLPQRWHDVKLVSVTGNGDSIQYALQKRDEGTFARIPLPACCASVNLVAHYQ